MLLTISHVTMKPSACCCLLYSNFELLGRTPSKFGPSEQFFYTFIPSNFEPLRKHLFLPSLEGLQTSFEVIRQDMKCLGQASYQGVVHRSGTRVEETNYDIKSHYIWLLVVNCIAFCFILKNHSTQVLVFILVPIHVRVV